MVSRHVVLIHSTQEELDVPYEIKKYQGNAEMVAPESLKKVHPLGKSPIITDGAVTLAESGAITGQCMTIWLVWSLVEHFFNLECFFRVFTREVWCKAPSYRRWSN